MPTSPEPSTRRHWLMLAAGSALAPAFVRHARAADVERFALGVASGYPQPDGMVLWTRLGGPDLPEAVPVRWELAHDEAFRRIARAGTALARADDAHSLHLQLRGLAPGRGYWYRFTALGQRSAAGRTRTAPAPGAAAGLRFVIASCQRWDHGHYAAWRDVVEQAPELVLFLGDYIYEAPRQGGMVRAHEGGECRTLAQYRARHAQYKRDPLLQAAHAAAPWVLVWDDHEVDNDYAGLQDAALSPTFAARRAAAYQAYWEHQPLPPSWRPRDGTMPLYGHLDWGRDVRILCLDGRQHRDPQACPRPGRGGSNTVQRRDCAALADAARTLLGPAQEAWLQRAAWRDTARWHLLAQQTLMSPVHWSDPAHAPEQRVWTDGWQGYPAARQRLLDALPRRDAGGCVVLGGDVHASYVADLHAEATDAASPIVAAEFCCTSISSLGMAQSHLDAMRGWNPSLHHARSQERGYTAFALQGEHLLATLRTVADPLDAASAVHTQARFAVTAGRPGVQAA